MRRQQLIADALNELVKAVRCELMAQKITYMVGDNSVTYFGENLGRLIAATIAAEAILNAD